MKRTTYLIIAILVLNIPGALAQKAETCKVLLNEIVGTYKGECKDGLANGKGTAKGKDTYVGTFKNGLPDGKGKYVYENGNVFTGNWSNGVKNGPGKFVYYIEGKEYKQEGYWKNGDYAGLTNPDESYRITNISGIENCFIKKVEGSEMKIKFSFEGALTKYVPDDLNITTSSGQVSKEGKNFVVYNYFCPNTCEVHFTIRTSGGVRECNLSFNILQPGNYEVVISNN